MHSIDLSLGNHQDLDQILIPLLYTSKLASFLSKLLILSSWWLLKKSSYTSPSVLFANRNIP